MAVLKKKKKKKKRSYGGGTGSSRGSEKRPGHVTKTPACVHTCPSGNKIRDFLTTLSQAEMLGKTTEQAYEEAWHIYTETSAFPATCGRVCPHPCEDGCNRTKKDGSVGINKIERVIGDFGLEKGLALKKLTDEKRDEKIAVVGAGPGGLNCAYQLARRGYQVTVFEAADKAGGMLLWGIPRYRLPADVLAGEIQKIVDLGVEIKCNTKVGSDVTMDQLRSDYDGIFVAIGAHKGKLLRVEGEDAENVISGVEFLNRVHHGEKIDVGSDVIVVGGGDTAIDAARICRRLGATTTIVYRRGRTEMPAIEPEIEEALEEGVKLHYLATPIGFKKDDNNRITHMVCMKQELGEPDSSGRRRPVPIEGSEFEIPTTTVIPAISQEPDFEGLDSLREGRDWFVVDKEQELIKEKGVWAGGDAVWLDIATTAIGHGRIAAEAIDRKLNETQPSSAEGPVIKDDRVKLEYYAEAARLEAGTLGVEERLAEMEAEVNLSLSTEDGVKEAARCMSCGYCFYCEQCWLICADNAINNPQKKGHTYTFELGKCTGCGKCFEICPCGFIDMN